jgi:hypothetical protein
MNGIFEYFLNLLNKLPSVKARHAFYGTLLYIFILAILSPVNVKIATVISLIVVTATGIAKEIYDFNHSEKHNAEILDAVFTAFFPSLFTIYLLVF